MMMLAFAVPGYILIKSKAVNESAIKAFSMMLLYVNQPFLSIYSFQQADYTPGLLMQLGIVFGLSAALQAIMMLSLYFIFRGIELKRKRIVPVITDGLQSAESDGARALFDETERKQTERYARSRVYVLTSTFGNVGFLGVPLLQALLPNNPEAVIFSATYIVSMNLLCWTLGLTLMTGDGRYLSLKKLFLNPPVITLCVALPLFFTGAELPGAVYTGIEFLARMTTPLCMLILGMRFATVNLKELFTDGGLYFAAAMKLVAFPLLCFAALHWLPVAPVIKVTLFILCCMPSASVVLNLSEINGKGQKTAANVILLTTLLSIITVPLLLLLA
jgi:predicted permease